MPGTELSAAGATDLEEPGLGALSAVLSDVGASVAGFALLLEIPETTPLAMSDPAASAAPGAPPRANPTAAFAPVRKIEDPLAPIADAMPVAAATRIGDGAPFFLDAPI